MPLRLAAHTSRVRTLAAQRPSQLLLVSLLLLLFIAAWYAASRAALTASGPASSSASTRIAAVTSRDEAMQTWVIPSPAPEVRIMPTPAPQVDPTDWSALSLGVSTVGVAPVASLATAGARPAEMNSSMSDRERRRLLASVKSGEPDGLPSPEGYTPGIVVLVPGGAHSDGICR